MDPALPSWKRTPPPCSRPAPSRSALAWAANDAEASALFGPLTEFRLRETLAHPARPAAGRRRPPSTRSGTTIRWPSGATALRGWLDAALAAPAWREPLAALAELQARRDDDRLELARREVLARWDEVQAARQAAEWDAALEELAALRQAIVTGGAKAHWDADALAEAREAMAGLRAYFDERLAPLADRKKPLRWALDEQAAELTAPAAAPPSSAPWPSTAAPRRSATPSTLTTWRPWPPTC